MNDTEERYFLWPKGIYRGYLYSIEYKENYSTYTFYTDFKASKKTGEHQLSAQLTLPTNAPVSDQDISDVFVESVAEKACSDMRVDSSEYVECLKTLPKGFFTERNVQNIIETIIKETMNSDTETIEKSDVACCNIMEYAHSQNHNVRKGTGIDYIGR